MKKSRIALAAAAAALGDIALASSRASCDHVHGHALRVLAKPEANMSDALENMLIDGLFRGGCLTSAGAAGSSAVVKGIWTASTAYALGDIVVPHANMTGAGGKLLKCTTAGTSGSTNTLAVPNPGSTLADNTVTWTAIATIPAELKLYAALFTINKGLRANSTAYSLNDVISLTPTGGAGGDTRQHLYKCTTAGTSAGSQPATYLGVPGEAITDSTAVFTELGPVIDSNTGFPAGLAEVSGGSYARVSLTAGSVPALADFAGTQAAASTTASTGTGGTTSNNATITFAAPTANWGQVGMVAVYDQLTGGVLKFWAALTAPKTINNGDSAPSFAAAAFTVQIDN